MPTDSTITAIEKSAQRGQVSIVVEGEVVLDIDKSIAEKYGLQVGQRLLPDRQEEIRQAAAVHEARTAAIKALGRRARTRRDLERRLLAKGLPEAAISEALDWLADRGYVNDELYAQTRLETLRKRQWGAKAIRQKLAQEGVPGPVAAELLSQQAEELHETELACELARAREARLSALPWPQRRSRIYQYLARRGFAAEVISEALAQIEPADRSSEGSEEA